MSTPETPAPDHHEHAKASQRPDDDQLARLADREREQMHAGGPQDVRDDTDKSR